MKTEKKAKITSFVLQKGGVGKSTTAVNLGIGLARKGKRVLLVDADSQANATQMLGLQQPDDHYFTLANLIEAQMNEAPLLFADGINEHAEGVDFIPANVDLSAAEVSLVNAMSRESVLRGIVRRLQTRYDHILIDCSPSLGMLTINALAASDSVIIPVQAGYLPVKGLEQLLKTIGKVRKSINPNLKIDGVLLTMAGRNNLSKNVDALIRESYGGKLNVFNTRIPYSVRAAEASATGKSIFAYEPNGKVAAAYENLTREVLALGREKSVGRSEPERV
jgi:chromosome partitioning protein